MSWYLSFPVCSRLVYSISKNPLTLSLQKRCLKFGFHVLKYIILTCQLIKIVFRNCEEACHKILQISLTTSCLEIYIYSYIINRFKKKKRTEKGEESRTIERTSSQQLRDDFHRTTSVTRTRQFCDTQVHRGNNPQGCILQTSNPTSCVCYCCCPNQARLDSTLPCKDTILSPFPTH